MSFPIEIKRGTTVVATIKPDSSSNQQKTVMGDNVINLQFDLNGVVEFKIGDTARVYGEDYYLNRPPIRKKKSEREYSYNMTMQADYYGLAKTQFMFYDSNNELKEGYFSLMGNASDFLDLIVKNANRLSLGWSKGAVGNTPYYNMTFKAESCLAVLGRLAQQFGTEWFVKGKVINLDKRQNDTGITLRIGKNKGLFELDDQPVGDTDVVTRLYAYGSDKNLPPDYRNFAQRLVMPGGVIFLEKNVEKYGAVEKTQVFQDVFPHRTGKITSVDAGNPQTFKDANIDFDVNAQLLPGISAKVTFNTGQLSGYTFDINKFDFDARQFYINKNKDEKAIDVPSPLFRPAIGDEYVLVDIQMPQTYIDKAEAELKQKAQELLNSISEPQMEYPIVSDPRWFRKKNIQFETGDLVWLTDSSMNVNRRIRVSAFTRPFDDEFNYQLTLADVVSSSYIADLQGATGSNARDIADINQRLNNSRASENNFIGNVIAADIPITDTLTGFYPVVVDGNGKFYRKV